MFRLIRRDCQNWETGFSLNRFGSHDLGGVVKHENPKFGKIFRLSDFSPHLGTGPASSTQSQDTIEVQSSPVHDPDRVSLVARVNCEYAGFRLDRSEVKAHFLILAIARLASWLKFWEESILSAFKHPIISSRLTSF